MLHAQGNHRTRLSVLRKASQQLSARVARVTSSHVKDTRDDVEHIEKGNVRASHLTHTRAHAKTQGRDRKLTRMSGVSALPHTSTLHVYNEALLLVCIRCAILIHSHLKSLLIFSCFLFALLSAA